MTRRWKPIGRFLYGQAANGKLSVRWRSNHRGVSYSQTPLERLSRQDWGSPVCFVFLRVWILEAGAGRSRTHTGSNRPASLLPARGTKEEASQTALYKKREFLLLILHPQMQPNALPT